MSSILRAANTALRHAAKINPITRSFASNANSGGFEIGGGSCPRTPSEYIGYGKTIPPPASSKPGKDDVKIEISRPFKGHKLEPPPPFAYTNPTELLHLYKVMAYYRRFEIVADTMYKQRLIRGFCHLYDGQVRPNKYIRHIKAI